MKKILSLILVICILIMPFKIFADTPTYHVVSTSDYELFRNKTGGTEKYYVKVTNSNSDVRAVFMGTGSNYALALISQNSFTCNIQARSQSTDSVIDTLQLTSSLTSVFDGYRYSIITSSGYTFGSSDSEFPVVNVLRTDQNVYDYTYGTNSVSPQPVQSWGLLNIRFNTDINTHDASDNQDNISWTSWDSNGNYIGDKQIEIRAVPGHYEAQDKPSLLQLKFINWVRESNLEVQVYKGSVVPEYKTFTWNYIAGLFSSIKTWQGRFWSIFASDSYWYQYGWIYEARILDTDDTPLSEWQEIVTGTASSPKDTEIIETSDELTPELYNVIYNINVYNDYQENWQINNTTINMQPDETLDNDKPWWVVLLEGILSILDKLLDMLLKLFVPTEFSIPEFTTNSNQYMQNTGIFGQAVQFVNDTGTSLQSVQNAEPVISIPAISWQNTTIIPAQSWNLNTLVNDYGLSDLHNMVYLVTDGFIYIGLIIMIRRKVIEALKK